MAVLDKSEDQVEAVRRNLRALVREPLASAAIHAADASIDAQTRAVTHVMRLARPLPPCLRDEYLVLVARALAGRDFGDGDVYRAARAAAKQVMETDVVLEVSFP